MITFESGNATPSKIPSVSATLSTDTSAPSTWKSKVVSVTLTANVVLTFDSGTWSDGDWCDILCFDSDGGTFSITYAGGGTLTPFSGGNKLRQLDEGYGVSVYITGNYISLTGKLKA